jgi:uncharacterized RDD family membrane protein YckC
VICWLFHELIQVSFLTFLLEEIGAYLSAIFSIFLYFPVFESSSAQSTPGERLLGMRVCSITYERLSFWQALKRNVIGGILISLVLLALVLGTILVKAMHLTDVYIFVASIVGIMISVFWYLSVFYIKLFSGGRQTLRDYFSNSLMVKTGVFL